MVPTALLGKIFCDTLLTQACAFLSKKQKLRSYKIDNMNMPKSFCGFWRRCGKDEKLWPSSTGCWRLVPPDSHFSSPPITAYCTLICSMVHVTLSINRKINWNFISSSHFSFNVRKSLLLLILFLQTQVLNEEPLYANYSSHPSVRLQLHLKLRIIQMNSLWTIFLYKTSEEREMIPRINFKQPYPVERTGI